MSSFRSQPARKAVDMNSVVLSSKDISMGISRIAHEILEKNKGADNIVLIGIQTRGATLSKRLRKKIQEIEKTEIKTGVLDIT